MAHREAVAAKPPPRYAGQRYWARPLPGFGDPRARLLLVGLAPAAHGGNRTGRMFTGDRSGDWLFDALHHAGFANQPTSVHRDDGLRLRDAYITATIRCAPPANKPLPDEIRALRAVSAGGAAPARARAGRGRRSAGSAGKAICARASGWRWRRRAAAPQFGHGAATDVRGRDHAAGVATIPSQQNTFTGKLTRPMLRGDLRAGARSGGRAGRRLAMTENPPATEVSRLVACRACGNRVARTARRCPACGAQDPSADKPAEPRPRQHRFRHASADRSRWIARVVVVAAALAVGILTVLLIARVSARRAEHAPAAEVNHAGGRRDAGGRGGAGDRGGRSADARAVALARSA